MGGFLCLCFLLGDINNVGNLGSDPRIQLYRNAYYTLAGEDPSVYVSSPGIQGCKVLPFTFPPPRDTRIQGPSVYVFTPGTQTVLGTLAVTSGFRNVGVTLHIHATLVHFTVLSLLCSALLYSTVFYLVI